MGEVVRVDTRAVIAAVRDVVRQQKVLVNSNTQCSVSMNNDCVWANMQMYNAIVEQRLLRLTPEPVADAIAILAGDVVQNPLFILP